VKNASDEHGNGNNAAIGTRRAWIFISCLLTAYCLPASRRKYAPVFNLKGLPQMKLGIIISQTDPETVFNALRLASYSLKQGDAVKVFLVGKGVELDQINDL
jgi:hypothetical protein